MKRKPTRREQGAAEEVSTYSRRVPSVAMIALPNRYLQSAFLTMCLSEYLWLECQSTH